MPETQTDNTYDLDKLTNPELAELGLPERRLLHNKRSQQLCTICDKEVKNPITRYDVGGIEFLKDGESAHQRCVDRRVNAMIRQFTQQMGEEVSE